MEGASRRGGWWGPGRVWGETGAVRERRLSLLLNYFIGLVIRWVVCNFWNSENKKLKRIQRVCKEECGKRGRKAVAM